jgi:hypothetical protein
MFVGRALSAAVPRGCMPLHMGARCFSIAAPLPVQLAQPPQPVYQPLVFPSLATPFTTLDVIGLGLLQDELQCDNLIRKRRRKMNKHKHSKMLKKQRFLRRKLGKL